MGSCKSKPAGGRHPPSRSLSVDDRMHNSAHGPEKTQRQKLAWHRDGVPVTDVYDILEIVGQGSMGEVTVCVKKVDTLDIVEKRTEDLAAKSERDDDETLKIAAELALNAKVSSRPRELGRQYACKTVNTLWMSTPDIMEFINEVEILRDLDHPNIVQLFEVYRVKRKMWLITELCSGGDLTARAGEMSEADVAIVLEQILRAIKYMHKRNCCHRDIKLENIMYADNSPSAPIKLIDFGLSNKFTKGQKMLRACGTVYTAAPELLLQEPYTEQTDMWSIGITAFVLLSGAYPFLREMDDLNDEAKKDKLANASFGFGPVWDERRVSNFGREFVTYCFKKNPADRWTAAEALDFVENQWIPYLESLPPASSLIKSPARRISSSGSTLDEAKGPNDGEIKENIQEMNPLARSVRSKRKMMRMTSGMIKGMQNYAEYSELKKTILMTMAYTMDKSSLHELRDIFIVLDSEGKGTVTLVDLQMALQQMNSEKHMDNETISKLFHGIDVDSSGQVHYNEFLAAVVESQGLITMEHLADAFDRLDSSGKGYISREDLKNILGEKHEEEVVDRMIDEADYKKNGQIDYEEFLRLMFEDPEAGMKAIGTARHARDAQMVQKLGAIDPASRLNSVVSGSSLGASESFASESFVSESEEEEILDR